MELSYSAYTAYHTHPHIPKTERIDTRGERDDGRGEILRGKEERVRRWR